MKKKLLLIISSFIISQGIVAQIISGQIVEMIKNKDALKIPRFAKASFLIESESEKIKIENGIVSASYEVEIGTSGKFKLDLRKISGPSLSLYLRSQNYVPMVLRNIPKNKLTEFIQIIPTTRIVFKDAGSFDSLWDVMNEKKSFKRKQLIVVDNIGKSKIVLIRVKNSFIAQNLERKEPIFDSKFFYEYLYK